MRHFMNWKTIKENIYFEDGALRDIVVYNTTKDDWKKWVDYVTTNYKVSTCEYKTETTKDSIDFNYILDFWTGDNDCNATTSVAVDKAIVNAHYLTELYFENDIDPREIKSEQDHNGIMKYMTDISKLLNKKVIMILENCPEIILVSVDRDAVTLNGK